MDFHSLNRRQLQSLCKLNKIPANITNVAMADALQSLQSVEGIEEYLNPVPSETAELPNEMPEKNELMSPVTSCRTSTRPKAKKTHADSVPATTIRGARKQVTVEADDGLKTQAVASTRKKALEASACQTIAGQDAVKKETTVKKAYSTRRSTRFTGKKSVETGEMDKEASQPVKIGSFLEEEDSGSLVSDKSLGSETSHESDMSSEKTKDSVEEGSVESFSKEKVENICNAFDNVDLAERQNEGDKFVLNKVDNSEEENAYVGSEEHSEGLLSDKASFVAEANPSGTPSPELEDMSNVVSEMKNETLEGSGSTNMAGDLIHLNSENPSDLSKLDMEVTEEEGMDFGPPAEEEHVNISKSQVDAVLVDFLNPKESSMNFEAPAEEEKDDTAVDMDADKITQESSMNFEAPAEEEKEDTAVDMDADKVTQESSMNFEAPAEEEKEDSAADMDADKVTQKSSMNFEAPAEEKDDIAVDMDADKVTQESSMNFEAPAADMDADKVTQESSMNFEAPAEDEKEDSAADKVTQESSMNFEAPAEEEKEDSAADKVTQESSMNFEAPAEEEKEDTAVDMDADKVTQESAADIANDVIDHPIHLSAMKQQTTRDGPTSLKEITRVDNDENSVTELQGATVEDNRSVNKKAGDEKPKSITDLSLRQLKKQLKALTIKSNSNTNKDDMVAEARPALQVVCDNQMATGEDN